MLQECDAICHHLYQNIYLKKSYFCKDNFLNNDEIGVKFKKYINQMLWYKNYPRNINLSQFSRHRYHYVTIHSLKKS